MPKSLTAAILFLATCTAFGQATCSTKSGPACDPRGSMALDYMKAHFGDSDSALEVWIHGDYGEAGKLRLEAREHKFELLAKWAMTLQDPDKGAWLGAIEFYEDQAKEAYSEWHTHKTEHEQQEYEAYLKRCREAERESSARRPLSQPPATLLKGKP